MQSQDDIWLKPYITAFLASSEASGKVMRGPIELGAYSSCVGRGGATPTFHTDKVGKISKHLSQQIVLTSGSEQLDTRQF